MSESNESVRARIVDAAITCFERFGEGKTSMNDIAASAGVGRQTVYRAFENRQMLLEAVALRYTEGHIATLHPIVTEAEDFGSAVIAGIIGAVQIMRGQTVMLQVLNAIGAETLEQFIMAPDSPVFRATAAIYGDAVRKAAKEGKLREGLSDNDVIIWLLNIHYLFQLRAELGPGEQEEILRKFVIPGLLKD